MDTNDTLLNYTNQPTFLLKIAMILDLISNIEPIIKDLSKKDLRCHDMIKLINQFRKAINVNSTKYQDYVLNKYNVIIYMSLYIIIYYDKYYIYLLF